MEKLIRDRIPAIVKAKGEALVGLRKVEGSERVHFLKKKLVEEVEEYLNDNAIGELADIMAVASALAREQHGTDWRRLLEIANAKRESRGGFRQGFVADIRPEPMPSRPYVRLHVETFDPMTMVDLSQENLTRLARMLRDPLDGHSPDCPGRPNMKGLCRPPCPRHRAA